MALAKSAITFDVQDCNVYTVADAIGAAYTASDPKDVPGIQEVSVEPNFITAEIKGDGGQVLAKKGKVDRLNFSCTYAELSLEVLAKLFGGSITSAAPADTTETNTFSIAGGSLPYFAIAFLLSDLQTGATGGTGDAVATVKMQLHKCQITGGTLLAGSTDDFATPSFTAECIIPQVTHTSFGTVTFAETAETLATY